jgi:ubiquinone/menaquinone biosynthesis C-methylase UbiE
MEAPMLVPFRDMISSLEAVAEPTRLRILALIADAELTVTELTTILGQSQPRVSRHLKLLVDAGLVDRHREGAWAFFRLSETPLALASAGQVLGGLDANDAVLAGDRARLAEVRAERARAAETYFARHADDWDQLRAMHVAEKDVEAAVLAAAGQGPFKAVLDLGTGTGRMLSLLAPRATRAVGIDSSHAMLAVARAKLEASSLKNVQLRQADIYALPVERNAYDLIVIHQVLHYLDDPARAIREAARGLRPGGRIIVDDFAPHTYESLRERHAHRRLGFARDEIDAMLQEAGLNPRDHRELPPTGKGQLTVSLWLADDPRVLDDRLRGASHTVREVA